jgi:outer membrane receptor for ferrienterochelin and colicins
VQGEEAVVSIEGLPPEYTRVLVNGQRYSGAIGGTDDLRDVPIHALERVEVKRGTQGIRQGGEGAGGVINLVTRKPPERGVHGSFDGGYGADGKLLASGASELRLGPVGVTLSAVHDQIDGFDPRGDAVFVPAGGEDSRRKSRDVYGTASWAPLEALELHSRIGWRREDENFVPVDADELPPERRDFRRWLATHGFSWSASPSTRITTDFTWYQGTLESEIGRPFTQDEDEGKLETQLEHFLTTGRFEHALTAGLDLRRPALQLDEGSAPAGVPDDFRAGGDTDESFRTGALFVEDEISLHERVSLLAGVRGELHSEFGFDVMPQVALLVKPHETLHARFSWGMNRRTPTLKDLYQPPVPQEAGYFLAGNPDLEPESSVSWRAGLEWTPTPWLAASATGFWNDIDDAIRSIGAGNIEVVTGTTTEFCPPFLCPPDGRFFEVDATEPRALFVKQNLDRLRTRGVEADLRVRPHPRAEARVAYTYLQTRLVDSNLVGLEELPNSPHHTVSTTLAVRAPRTETELTLTGVWRSPAIIETSGTGIASFAGIEKSHRSLVINARVAQPLRSGVEVYVDLQNLTGEKAVDSYAIRGFTFFVGLRADLSWPGRATP